MNELWWIPIGLGIYVFVAVVLPLLISLVDKAENREDAIEVVKLSWAWPVIVPLFTVVGAIYGATEAVLWAGRKTSVIGVRYVDILVSKPKSDSKTLQGKVVE